MDERGPLATFDQKIRMADALGLFAGYVTRKDLDIIRRIRNDFAHDLTVNSFDRHDVRQRIEALNITKDTAPARARPPDHRVMFVLAVQLLFGFLLESGLKGQPGKA